MPRLSEEEWREVRLCRESTGMSFRLLSEKFGVSDVAILKKSKKENWGDGGNANDVANRLAMERASGIAPDKGNNFAARTASIHEAADRKAAILERQQSDWEGHREDYVKPVLQDAEGNQLQETPRERQMRLGAAKTAAEMLRIRHEGERRAYGISDQPSASENQGRPLSDFYGS